MMEKSTSPAIKRHGRHGSGRLHDFYLQALFTEEPCLCRQVGYRMSYDSGCIADANFLLFRLPRRLPHRGRTEGEGRCSRRVLSCVPPPVFHKLI